MPTTPRRLTVNVTVTLHIDPEAWDRAYGTGTTAAQIRPDARNYVLSLVQDSAAAQVDQAVVQTDLRN